MADATITELRPSPQTGEASRPKTKDRTAAERKRRSRAKRKHRDTPVTVAGHGVTAPVTVAHSTGRAVDLTAYMAAIGLASVAALFSVKGMVQLFPGAPVLIIAMASMMEASKLVAAGWLGRRWRVTAWIWRAVLVVLIVGLAGINATGVYAQLVAAHVGDRGAAAATIETQDAAFAARIEVAAHVVDDLDRRLGQIDTAIETAAKRGKTSTALSAIESQKKARAGLAGERNEAAGTFGGPQGGTRSGGR